MGIQSFILISSFFSYAVQGLWELQIAHFAKIAIEHKRGNSIASIGTNEEHVMVGFTYQVCRVSEEYPRSYKHLFT